MNVVLIEGAAGVVCEEMVGMRSQWMWQATVNMRRGMEGDIRDGTSKDGRAKQSSQI